MPATNGQGVIHHAALEELRKWRAIQLSSLLPLTLCVVFMFYTQEASGVWAIVFFVLVAVGVVFPEMKSDIALNRLIIMEEQTEISMQFRQLLAGELQYLLKNPAIRDLLKEEVVSSESSQR
jgi:hypothetical protein